MNDFTKIAGIPSGGGQASNPKPERTEAKKPEPAPVQQNWWDLAYPTPENNPLGIGIRQPTTSYQWGRPMGQVRNVREGNDFVTYVYDDLGALMCIQTVSGMYEQEAAPTAAPMTDYFKEQQEISLQWPEIDGFEPFGYCERN